MSRAAYTQRTSLFEKPVKLNRLMLIGCTKGKQDRPDDNMSGGRVVPEQLYLSPLFS